MNTLFKKAPICLALILLAASACVRTSAEPAPPAGQTEQTEQPEQSKQPEQSEQPAATQSTGTVYPLAIDNFDSEGNRFLQTFDRAPERVVATTQGSIEALLKLGLGGKIAAAANIISDFPDDIRAEGESLNVIPGQWPSMEVVLGESPDLIMGRAFDFFEGEGGLGTVADYAGMGINCYIWASSSITGDPVLEDIITDIRAIGQIFDVEPRANAFADELQAKLDRLETALAGRPGDKTALMITDFDGSVYSQYGVKAKLQNDFLAKLGYRNATEQAGASLGLETMIALSPDIIIYIDYAGSALNAESAIADLLTQTSLQNVPAIQNKAVYRVPFNDIMGHGYRTIEGLANLAEQIDPDAVN
jgi:iron complex transport system substrate-binding protein